MKNRSMLRKLAEGQCVDLSVCETTPEGDYVVPEEVWEKIRLEGKDVIDGVLEVWIGSIGRRRNDKIILASVTGKFYQNQDFECLWLR